MDTEVRDELRTLIDAALRGRVSDEQAKRVHELGAEAVSAFVLAVTQRFAELGIQNNAHTPSGAVPVHVKPPAKKRRRGKPGARPGHAGHRRPTPIVSKYVELKPLKLCPECNGEVLAPTRKRRRIVEDMPADVGVQATQYTIPGHWCPACGKHVEPRVPRVLPGATIGNRLVALTGVFHYGLGLTIEQTQRVLLSPLQTHISAGGLVDLWRRLAEVLTPWYERIGDDARDSATLHGDETGWRVDGQTHWLWCFCNHHNCYYLIDRARGSPALRRFFTEAFAGVLIHDFWRPYNRVLLEPGGEGGGGEHQCCLVHLLRELDHVDERNRSDEWAAFVKTLRRLIRDGIRLRRREDFSPGRYESRIHRIDQRLVTLAEASYADPDAVRLAGRLSRHRDELFTFLDRPEADWNNNFAERQVRPAVILRKNSQCNRSARGAATQAVLMSVYRTLKLRGHDPRTAIEQAINAYAESGALPPLPGVVAGG